MGYQLMGLHFNVGDDLKAAPKVQPMGIGIISQGDQTQGLKSLFNGLLPGQGYQFSADTLASKIFIDTQGIDIKAVVDTTA